ncbi:MAG: hypothetical protein PHQ28_06170 [Mycobacterium sp.]|nr:hypothetical protein [Mycobacterium sp.]
MADRWDVAERLGEGRSAVEHTQTYVRACQALGYRQPALTSRPSRIRDWYETEDGLDLQALDRDCAQLRAAGEAAAEGLRLQRAQVAELSAAWTGPGGASAVAFLQRHCDAANTVAVEVRAAAQRCESLRDNLWHLLDSKVTTAIAVDDGTQPQRPEWLAAAAAVTTGTGDRAAAEQVIRQQVIPYVDTDICNDWLTVMRSTVAGVAASYDMVVDRMAAAPAGRFQFPDDFGPGCPPQPVPPGVPAVTATVAPAAAVSNPAADSAPAPVPTAAVPPMLAASPTAAVPPMPAASPTAAAPPTAVASPTAAAPPTDFGSAFGDALPAGDPGGGLGGLGGLSGLASRIVDAMNGLLGSAADPPALDDPSDAEDSFRADPFHPDDAPDDHDDAPDDHDDAPDDHDAPDHDGADNEPDEAEDIGTATGTDEASLGEQAQPPDAPAPADGPLTADPPAPTDQSKPIGVTPAPAAGDAVKGAEEESTPCEIAADQLPQAGQ